MMSKILNFKTEKTLLVKIFDGDSGYPQQISKNLIIFTDRTESSIKVIDIRKNNAIKMVLITQSLKESKFTWYGAFKAKRN